MRDPRKLYEEEHERSLNSPFRCLQHGDIWHNNCLFKHLPTGAVKFALVDWQVWLSIDLRGLKINSFFDLIKIKPYFSLLLVGEINHHLFASDLLLWKCSK